MTEPACTPEGSAAVASSAVVREWGRRVHAEYRSAAITHHLTLWLIQLGAAPDVLEEGLRIVADELAHAELSHAVHVEAGGPPLPPLPRELLGLTRVKGEPLEAAIARAAVEVFCLGETVAVPLFKELRAPCVVGSARRAFDRILRDEVRHREFGWRVLDDLLALPCADEVCALVVRELPARFGRLRRSYAPEVEGGVPEVIEADAAWGLMPMGNYARVLGATLEREYVPWFAARGIDARAAWHDATALIERRSG
ncbi:MAG: ferritin-like domain-containing protein [Deltaproteobacteria bacterium]|nr:ferritin-like domain-containing protein [Deltaproteobacteria bacterium]